MIAMHDWTLISISFDWINSHTKIVFFNTDSLEEEITASNVAKIVIPQENEWGKSVSVNGLNGPHQIYDSMYSLEIEMQSGDTIYLEAESITVPKMILE